jgi:hypothetical protein
VSIPVLGTALVIIGNIKSPTWPACRFHQANGDGVASYSWYLLHLACAFNDKIQQVNPI